VTSVLVAGAGAMGFAAAYRLAGDGCEVTVVEAASRVGGSPASLSRPWTGARPMTPDGLPVVGPLTGRDSVLVASGHAKPGVTLAPATAELITAMVNAGTGVGALPDTVRPFLPQRLVTRYRRPGAPTTGGR